MLGSSQDHPQCGGAHHHHHHHKTLHKSTTRIRVALPSTPPAAPPRNGTPHPRHSFTKIFRWRVPAGFEPAPKTVEVVGSFTHWEKVPLKREVEHGIWTVTLSDIPFNRTHHYMLLADGKPVRDEHADGMAVPHGPEEEKYQLVTPRGGRVFMLYSQTK